MWNPPALRRRKLPKNPRLPQKKCVDVLERCQNRAQVRSADPKSGIQTPSKPAAPAGP